MAGRIIKQDFNGLNDFAKALSSKDVVRVGMMGSKGSKQHGDSKNSDLSNSDLGAIHEFGSFSRGIPARSWLRMPIHREAQAIIQATGAGSVAREMVATGETRPLLVRLGIACEKAIQHAFDSAGFGSWKPNTRATARRKGSNAPLIDTGQMERAVSSKVAKPS